MNRPLTIRDIHNISLTASNINSNVYPQLVTQFSCQYRPHSKGCIHIEKILYTVLYPIEVCCAVIHLINVTNSTFSHITIAIRSPNASGVILQQCSDILIQIFEVEGHSDSQRYITYEVGNLIYESTSVVMDSLQVSNSSYGVILFNTSNSYIKNTAAMNCKLSGISLIITNTSSIINTISSNYSDYGVVLQSTNNVNITNVTAAYNKHTGVWLVRCENTKIITISAVHNQQNGIVLEYCNDTSIINVSATHNQFPGIALNQCKDTSMINISAAYNHGNGIVLEQCNYSHIINTNAAHNQYPGIVLQQCKDTSIVNIFAAYNENHGIQLLHCKDTCMINISAANNEYLGIVVSNCTNTSMKDVSVANSGQNGLFLDQCTDTRMININGNRGLSLLDCTASTILEDSIFLNIFTPGTSSGTDPSTLPAVITLYNSFLTIKNCNFTRNSVSSVNAVDSTIRVIGKAIFSDNIALSGTAFIFERKSKLIISDDSYMIFQNNHASHYGGVLNVRTEETYDTSIYLEDIKTLNPKMISKTECFVHVEGIRLDTRLIFMNNTAGKGGDILYGGLVALGYDGDWNCLLSFKNVSDISQQSGLSVISSEPSRVCLCNMTGQPDCLTVADPKPRTIYPGQTIIVPAVVIGQDFGTVTGSVFASFLNASYTTGSVDIEKEQKIRIVEQTQCSSLEYTIFSQDEQSEAVLVLTTGILDILHIMDIQDNREIANTWTILNSEPNYKKLASDYILDFIRECGEVRCYTDDYYRSRSTANRTIEDFYKFTPGNIDKLTPVDIHNKFIFPNEIYNYPVFINISFRSCPAGFTLSRQVPFKCDCNQLLQQFQGVKCHIQHQTIT